MFQEYSVNGTHYQHGVITFSLNDIKSPFTAMPEAIVHVVKLNTCILRFT